MMHKHIFSLLVLIIFAGSAYGAIKISPSYIELDANKTRKDYISESFAVAGGANETIRFKVSADYFEIDKSGIVNVIKDQGQKCSLVSRLNIYPKEFTVQNGKEQKVRFTLTNLKTLPEGESRLVVFLEDVNTKEIFIQKSLNGFGGRIIVKTRVGVPIYIDKGNYVKKGNLDNIVLKKTGDDYFCEYKVSSLGNSKIRYKGIAQLIQGDNLIEEIKINGLIVEGGKFVETAQKFDIPKEKIDPCKEYKIRFVLNYKDEKQNDKYLKKELIFIPEKLAETKI